MFFNQIILVSLYIFKVFLILISKPTDAQKGRAAAERRKAELPKLRAELQRKYSNFLGFGG